MSTHITRISLIYRYLEISHGSRAARGKQETHLLCSRSRTFWEKKQEKDFINRIVFCPEEAENTEVRMTIAPNNSKTFILVDDHVMTLKKQEAVW